MAKTDEGKASANELQGYVDLVDYARMLWPDTIMTLTAEKLEVIIDAFNVNKVDFVDQVKLLLVQRRALVLASNYGKATKDTSVVNQMFEILSPLPPSGMRNGFDPKHPQMSEVAGVAESIRWSKAASIFTKRLLVPRIAGGEEAIPIVCACASVIVNGLASVDFVQLEDAAAAVCSEWLDSSKAVLAVAGTITDFLSYADEFDTLLAVSNIEASVSSSLKGALTNNKFFSDRIATRQQQQQTLMSVWPDIQHAQESLACEGNDVFEALVNASRLVVQYTDNIDPEAFSQLSVAIQSKGTEAFSRLKRQVSDTIASGCNETDDIANNSRLASCSNMLHEVSLAFPDSAWVHDMQAELADTLRKQSSASFHLKFCNILSALSEKLSAENSHPPTTQVQALTKTLAEAKPLLHFNDEGCLNAMSTCLTAFFSHIEARCDEPWRETATTMAGLLPFGGEVLSTRFPMNMVVAAISTHSATKLVSELSARLQESGWKDVVSALLRAKSALCEASSTSKAAFTIEGEDPVPDDSNMTQALKSLKSICNSLAVDAEKALEGVRNAAQETSTTKLNDMEKNAIALARGCDEDDWLAGKTLAQWSSWPALVERFRETVQSMKPAVFKGALADAESLFAEVSEINALFGDGFLSMSSATQATNKLALTRSTGKLIRWLEKGEKDPQVLRNNVRSELLDLIKRHGDGWDYKQKLPKALADEMTSVLAAKHKRATKH